MLIIYDNISECTTNMQDTAKNSSLGTLATAICWKVLPEKKGDNDKFCMD